MPRGMSFAAPVFKSVAGRVDYIARIGAASGLGEEPELLLARGFDLLAFVLSFGHRTMSVNTSLQCLLQARAGDDRGQHDVRKLRSAARLSACSLPIVSWSLRWPASRTRILDQVSFSDRMQLIVLRPGVLAGSIDSVQCPDFLGALDGGHVVIRDREGALQHLAEPEVGRFWHIGQYTLKIRGLRGNLLGRPVPACTHRSQDRQARIVRWGNEFHAAEFTVCAPEAVRVDVSLGAEFQVRRSRATPRQMMPLERSVGST